MLLWAFFWVLFPLSAFWVLFWALIWALFLLSTFLSAFLSTQELTQGTSEPYSGVGQKAHKAKHSLAASSSTSQITLMTWSEELMRMMVMMWEGPKGSGRTNSPRLALGFSSDPTPTPLLLSYIRKEFHSWTTKILTQPTYVYIKKTIHINCWDFFWVHCISQKVKATRPILV